MSETLSLGERAIRLDKEGHLEDLTDWSTDVALELARREGIELRDAHWDIIHLIRDFHARRGLSPVMRVLVKLLERHYGPEKGNSLYLLTLFPGSPARLAAKIAGLPRPTNCL